MKVSLTYFDSIKYNKKEFSLSVISSLAVSVFSGFFFIPLLIVPVTLEKFRHYHFCCKIRKEYHRYGQYSGRTVKGAIE